MTSSVTLSPKFGSPAARAGLEVYLILAEVCRDALLAEGEEWLEGTESSWLNVLNLLGVVAATEVPRYGAVSQIDNLWKQFLNKAAISVLPKTSLEILERAQHRSVELANQKGRESALLDDANRHAHGLIHELLRKQKIKAGPGGPAPVFVEYDPDAKQYCASGSAITEQIRWAHQPKQSHLLLGLIIADYVFAHEYLSHLLPKNPDLDTNVRERWLVATLVHSVVTGAGMPRWKRLLWMAYQGEVLQYVAAERERQDPEAALDEAILGELVQSEAGSLYWSRPEQFWALTREMLELGKSKNAEPINDTLRGLDRIIPDLEEGKTYSFTQLHAMVLNK